MRCGLKREHALANLIMQADVVKLPKAAAKGSFSSDEASLSRGGLRPSSDWGGLRPCVFRGRAVFCRLRLPTAWRGLARDGLHGGFADGSLRRARPQVLGQHQQHGHHGPSHRQLGWPAVHQAAVSRRHRTNRCLTAGKVSDGAIFGMLGGRSSLGVRLVSSSVS